jgi:hypothetical protein
MNDLSPTTKALLSAARDDRPGAIARSKIWSGVAAKAAGGSALGGASAAAKAAASAGTAKLFVMGALLGSAVTVGIAAMALRVGTPSLHPDPTVIVHADTETEAVAPAARATATVEDAPRAMPAPARAKHSIGHPRSLDDTLAREAELVAEARGAVVRGQPAAALSAIHAAQALPGHALEPEELSLEVRALRALGRLDAANAADARLRTQYPDNALSR